MAFYINILHCVECLVLQCKLAPAALRS